MTTRQTIYSNGTKSVPQGSRDAGSDIAFLAEYSLAVGAGPALVAASDRVEMFILPAGMVITDMAVMGVAGSAITCNVGIMSGTAGDPDNARTVGAEYFTAASLNAAGAVRMTQDSGFKVPAVDYDRGVGVTVSADMALGAGRYIRLKVNMAANP